MQIFSRISIVEIILGMLLVSCAGSNLLSKKSERTAYADKIGKSNPRGAVAWRNAGDFALLHPLQVPSEYVEEAFVSGERPDATGFAFSAKAGQQISIELIRKSTAGLSVFMELFDVNNRQQPKLIAAADTVANYIRFSSTLNGNYVVRLQPALGSAGAYTFSIRTGGMLGWPIASDVKNNVGSVWGDARDGGIRKHEGIDIMAKKGSNIIAVADGVIDYVEENEIGGKVISLKPTGKSFSVYYAHLQQQLVEDGQKVKKGDIIGTVGNTGNAKNTVPHLHFGIYLKNNEAIDPLPFVQQTTLPPIEQPAAINKWFQTNGSVKFYPSPEKKNAFDVKGPQKIKTESLTHNFYRVVLQNGAKAFVAAADLR